MPISRRTAPISPFRSTDISLPKCRPFFPKVPTSESDNNCVTIGQQLSHIRTTTVVRLLGRIFSGLTLLHKANHLLIFSMRYGILLGRQVYFSGSNRSNASLRRRSSARIFFSLSTTSAWRMTSSLLSRNLFLAPASVNPCSFNR